jgi:hypothetical protein
MGHSDGVLGVRDRCENAPVVDDVDEHGARVARAHNGAVDFCCLRAGELDLGEVRERGVRRRLVFVHDPFRRRQAERRVVGQRTRGRSRRVRVRVGDTDGPARRAGRSDGESDNVARFGRKAVGESLLAVRTRPLPEGCNTAGKFRDQVTA